MADETGKGLRESCKWRRGLVVFEVVGYREVGRQQGEDHSLCL